jgi:hypothetical protein
LAEQETCYPATTTSRSRRENENDHDADEGMTVFGVSMTPAVSKPAVQTIESESSLLFSFAVLSWGELWLIRPELSLILPRAM